MKDNEIALKFSEKWIKDRMTLPSADGGTYELYIIEMPNEEGDDIEPKRTFTVPVSRVHQDQDKEYLKYTYLLKERQYRVMRAEYDRENRASRVIETCTMSAEDIKAVFDRYRDRKRKNFENQFIPEEKKEN